MNVREMATSAHRALEVQYELTRALARLLGDRLLAVYLHGSLALGCWHPRLSDVDVLAVTRDRLSTSERRALAGLALSRSAPRGHGPPYALELQLVSWPDLHPWRYPPTVDFSYDESRRDALERGEWSLRATDRQLAAHVGLVRMAGIALHGPPPDRVLPAVPDEDYLDAAVHDLAWCREHATLLYAVLTPARIWATLSEPAVAHSKLSGGEWALARLPREHRALLAAALAAYRGESDEAEFPREAVRRYIDWIESRLEPGGTIAAPA